MVLPCCINENAKLGEEFMNRQIVSASDAIKAAEEFAATLTQPH
jgi:hypothetical protein